MKTPWSGALLWREDYAGCMQSRHAFLAAEPFVAKRLDRVSQGG